MHQHSSPTFKGWTKPGPIPPGIHGQAPPLEPGESLDAISGYYRIYQLRKGHRFSTDDVLTAWYGTCWAPCARSALDLGSGVGSVGMMAAWRLPGARFVTVEAQPESVALAKKSILYNGLQDRFEIRLGDFRDSGVIHPDEQFDLILGSPPYFPEGSGILGDHPQKIACRFELRGSIVDYCLIAAQHLSPGGLFACIFPTDQIDRVEKSAHDARLSLIRKRPIVFREEELPLLTLFAFANSNDLPSTFRHQTWIEPPLIIRTKDGGIHLEYSAIKLAIGFPP